MFESPQAGQRGTASDPCDRGALLVVDVAAGEMSDDQIHELLTCVFRYSAHAVALGHVGHRGRCNPSPAGDRSDVVTAGVVAQDPLPELLGELRSVRPTARGTWWASRMRYSRVRGI